MYTWYVNAMGEVQIYKGDIGESHIYDFWSEEDARNHNILSVDLTPQYYTKVDYYIPFDYVSVFFTLIGSPTYYIGSSGCTNINVSDFLD